jgi:chorismate mutase
MTAPPPALEELRARLDEIDVRLLELLRDRIACCAEIARVKADHDVPMMQPHRIGLVRQRAAAFGALHGIDVGFLHSLYDLVIAETCRVEDAVIAERSRPCAPC